MSNTQEKQKPQSQEEITISGYGLSMVINGQGGKPLILDAEGNPVVDVAARVAAQEKLVLPLIKNLGASWQQELKDMASATQKVTALSNNITAAFAVPTNDNDKPQARIGYRAMDGTIYAGQNRDGEYCYTTPANMGRMTWIKANKKLQEHNNNKSLHGHDDWSLPTGEGSKTNELWELFYKNREAIGGFYNDFYWSATELSTFNARGLYFADGDWLNTNKYSRDWSVRPVRRLNHLVI